MFTLWNIVIISDHTASNVISLRMKFKKFIRKTTLVSYAYIFNMENFN